MRGPVLSALHAMPYSLLYTSIANLRRGVEMHYIFVCSRVFLVLRLFPLSPVPAFSWFCVFPDLVPVSSLYGISAWPTRPGTGPRGPRYSEALV